MKIFNRITTTIGSALDRAVGSIENHDALLQASIEQIRRKNAEVKARLNRVRSDIVRLDRKGKELNKQSALWAERAMASDADESIAIQCMKRRKECLEQIEALEVSRRQLKEVEERLATNVAQIEKRVGELQQRRSVMRSRQAAADACKLSDTLEQGCCVTDIDDTIERWDAQILESEVHCEVYSPGDELERQFSTEEEQASLRAELAALRNSQGEA